MGYDGKPYEQMDDLGGKKPYFWFNTHIPSYPHFLKPSIATSGSKNSTAVGSPAAKISRSTRRPKAKPLAMSSEPVKVGSLMRPRQPTAVRGFSKYVLRGFCGFFFGGGNWVVKVLEGFFMEVNHILTH